MIRDLSIKNFKSITNLDLKCKRVNIFIGNPNTGKSNLLESLNLLNYNNDSLTSFIRFENISNLFTDYDIFLKIKIKADDLLSESWIENDEFVTETWVGQQGSPFKSNFHLNGKFSRGSSNPLINSIPQIKFYRYNSNVLFQSGKKTSLETPDGQNLPSVILSRKDLRAYIQELLAGMNFKLLINPIENRIEIYKEESITISFPFASISDTVKRIIFYTAAIHSNRNSVILLEEPEAHIFPFYSNEIARQIVNDVGNNQFFIVTHNPYLLQTLIENTASVDLQVNIAYMEGYQTKIHQITSEKDISELIDMESSAFFRFDEFIK